MYTYRQFIKDFYYKTEDERLAERNQELISLGLSLLNENTHPEGKEAPDKNKNIS